MHPLKSFFTSTFSLSSRAHISFTPNGRYLLSTTLDSTTRLWNFHTSKSVKTFSGGLNEKYGCPSTFLVRPRSDTKQQEGEEEEVWIVGGSEDGRVLAWEVQSREVRLDLKAHQGPSPYTFSLSLSLSRGFNDK